jgi:hypothetical protein
MKTIPHLFAISVAAALSSGFATQAVAADLTNFSTVTQAQFVALSKDLAAVTSTKAMEPAAPLGLAGFDISASTAMTQTKAGAAWNAVTGGGAVHLTQTKLSVTKGLPWGIDVGAFTSTVASTNVTAKGFHLKYALIDGGALMPAVALRGNYSKTSGVSQMDLTNTGYDLLISKGFVGFTPYAGVGTVRTQANVQGVSQLSSTSFSQNKSFVGFSWNMLMLNLCAEYERIGEASTYGLKAGLRF